MPRRIKAIPPYYPVAIVVGLVIGVFAIMLWPQRVTFSYQGPTCIGQPHFAPELVSGDSSVFKVEPSSVQKIGSTSVLARGLCFTPVTAPAPGNYQVAVELPGLPIKKSVTIHVPSHPVASAVQLKDPVPLSKRLVIALSSSDVIFSYHLKAEGKTVKCDAQQYGIGCDIKKLNLKQGTEYTLQLDRYFNGKQVATLLDTKIMTLKAVALVSSSIKQGEIVFSKPKSMTLQFDKPITKFEASLVQVGDKKEVSFEHSIKDKEVVLTWKDDLARLQSYELSLTGVQAADGSMLADSTSIGFKMSGGPLVTNVSVGTYKVALGATATITFDQPLSQTQDIGQIVTATGGARIVGRQAQSVTVGFANVPRCMDVAIKISDGLESSFGITGGTSWQYQTRMICQSVISIGASSKGRAINAYLFGTGAKKVVYTGAVHGDEVSTRALMLRWIDALEANPRSIPSDKTVIVIPTVNPDGFAAGTRTNARNVDLNRNFATSDWQRDITTVTNQPFPGGGGASALSEPESAAIASYIGSVHPTLILSYHSIGGLVAANQIGGSSLLAKKYASLSGYSNSTGVSDTFDYTVSGTADDYYGQVLGVPSILVELGSHTYHQFESNQQAMWAMLRDT